MIANVVADVRVMPQRDFRWEAHWKRKLQQMRHLLREYHRCCESQPTDPTERRECDALAGLLEMLRGRLAVIMQEGTSAGTGTRLRFEQAYREFLFRLARARQLIE